MNQRIKRLRAEIEKYERKIATLQEKNRELKKELQAQENMEIVGLVREQGLSLEELAVMMQQIRDNPIPPACQTQNDQEVNNDA